MVLSRVRSFFEVGNPQKVGLVTVAHGVNEFYSVALPPILPLLVADFNVSYAEAGFLLTVYFLVYSVFQLPSGRLSDRIGQRYLLASGMIVLAAGILVVALAQDFRMLLAGEVIAGIGGSTYHPSGMSLISDIESDVTEGRAMGVHGFGGVAGTALAPALIGGLAAVYDWRLALFVAAGVGVVYAAVFLLAFEDAPREAPPESMQTDGGTASLRERALKVVNIPLEVWVLVLFIANFAIALEVAALRTFATSYLFERTGTTALSNAVFFVMLVGAGVASLGAGRLADVVSRTWLGFGAMVTSAVVLAATVLVPANPVALVAWFFLLGVVAYAAFPAVNAITSARSESEFSGSLFAVTLTAGSLGGAAGPALVGVLAERIGLVLAFPAVSVTGALAAAMILLLRQV